MRDIIILKYISLNYFLYFSFLFSWITIIPTRFEFFEHSEKLKHRKDLGKNLANAFSKHGKLDEQ